MLEAQRAGCQIVASDVGGASEIDYDLLHLVPVDSNDSQFVDTILRCLKTKRSCVNDFVEDGLVPFLWSAIGNYGWWQPPLTKPSVHVYLSSERALQSIFSMIENNEGGEKVFIGLFGTPRLDVQERFESVGIRLHRLPVEAGRLGQARAALRYIAQCEASVVHLGGIEIELKLLLAKVLDPAVTLLDADSPATIFETLKPHAKFQHRLCMDGSEYYARLSADPSSDARLPATDAC
jgi:hypothetical protein